MCLYTMLQESLKDKTTENSDCKNDDNDAWRMFTNSSAKSKISNGSAVLNRKRKHAHSDLREEKCGRTSPRHIETITFDNKILYKTEQSFSD